MGGLKTFLAALALAASLPGPASADDDLLRTIASCAGRLSAQMEHQWLMGDAEADRTEARRGAMLEILSALAPPGDAPSVLSWRIDAKVAHSSLLTRATFNPDPDDSGWARRQADMMIADCNGLILG